MMRMRCYYAITFLISSYRPMSSMSDRRMTKSSSSSSSSEDDQVLHQLHPFVRVYKSGRIDRLVGTKVLPAGLDPATRVSSKDVSLLPGVSARLYLPPSAASARLPVLVYFHGGNFIAETPFSPTYHPFLNSLSAASAALSVSVHYRRAPEHPLPAAHDDSWAALTWVFSHSAGAGPDPWLNAHADFARITVAGDSAGANIAHDMALRAGKNSLLLSGTALIHPMFWGSSLGRAAPHLEEFVEKTMQLVCPNGAGIDDPWLNPLVGGAEKMAGMGCRSVLVCVAEKDFLKDWGRAYYRALATSGWRGAAELVETEGEGHIFHLLKPGRRSARKLLGRLAAFVNGRCVDSSL